MKYYRVFTDDGMDAVILCENERHASIAARELPKFKDASFVNVRLASFHQIELQALADWNAGKSTASPLVLARARGEL